MENDFAVVLTTCSNEKDSKVIIDALLSKNLAACIQIQNVNSFYKWEGGVANDPEVLLFIKCKQVDFKEIKDTIVANHNYDLPEIIEIPIINGLESYLDWIKEETK